MVGVVDISVACRHFSSHILMGIRAGLVFLDIASVQVGVLCLRPHGHVARVFSLVADMLDSTIDGWRANSSKDVLTRATGANSLNAIPFPFSDKST